MRSIKEYIFNKGAQSKTPVNATFELTPRCNFNCKMCYIHTDMNDEEKRSAELSAEEWIELGRQAVGMGTVYLLLTGGEPTLRPDFCYIYSSLVKLGLMVSVNTNGSVLSDEMIECFKKYRPERINITLYGVSEETYCELCGASKGWSRASENIDRLLKAGVLVTLNTTFTSLNIGEMKGIVEFAKERNIPIRTSGHIFPPVRGGSGDKTVSLSPSQQGIACAEFDIMTLDDETLKRRISNIRACYENDAATEIEDVSKASRCMAGKSSFWISWDGKMLPCGMLALHSQDVRELGLETAWKNTTDETQRIFLPKECTNCKWRPVCSSCAAIFECSCARSDKLFSDICDKTKAYADRLMDL